MKKSVLTAAGVLFLFLGCDMEFINLPPIADAGEDIICVTGEPVLFDGSGSSDPEDASLLYFWDFGDGDTGLGVSVEHSYLSAGEYSVVLTVEDEGGRQNTDMLSVTVSEEAPVNNPPAADAGEDKNAQTGGTVLFNGSGSSDPDGDDLTYNWDFGDGNSASGVTASHTYNAPGMYTVTLTVTDTGELSSTDEAAVHITDPEPVNHAPVADAGDDITAEAGSTVLFDGSGSTDPDGDDMTYTWDFGDGSSSTGVSASRTFGSAGIYTVTLTVTDTGFLTDTDERRVTVLDPDESSRIADHAVVSMLMNGNIPETAVQAAKDTLHIGYGHTSHGSQITSGMSGLVAFSNANTFGTTDYSDNLFQWSDDGGGDSLHLFEGSGYQEGYLSRDVGYRGWEDKTRTFLDENPEYNVIMWSWCGQVDSYDEEGLLEYYLLPMTQLEAEYPDVTFIYMTGHLEGRGLDGSVFRSNEQIRQYCRENNKWLFDFADIESYDPDGNYYGDKLADDDCNYDADSDGVLEMSSGDPATPADGDANWAIDWQNSHIEDTDWYYCYAAHSYPVNANMKAYAAWWLWARLGGWDGRLP